MTAHLHAQIAEQEREVHILKCIARETRNEGSGEAKTSRFIGKFENFDAAAWKRRVFGVLWERLHRSPHPPFSQGGLTHRR